MPYSTSKVTSFESCRPDTDTRTPPTDYSTRPLKWLHGIYVSGEDNDITSKLAATLRG